MMNILYLCADLGVPVLGSKGASAHVRGLVNALVRAGHAVVLATPLLNKSPWERPASVAASLLHLPPSADIAAACLALKEYNESVEVDNSLPGELRRLLYNQDLAMQLKRRFEHHPPDFIYERCSLYSTAGAAVARELNRPFIIELNAPLPLEQPTYRATGLGELAAQAERFVLSQASAVLVVSRPLQDYVNSLGVASERVHVIPNGVDAGLFRPGPPGSDERARWGLSSGLVLGYVGGLRRWHGVDALPALLERLVPRYPGLQLVIVGDGPLRGELEQRLREAGFHQRTVFTGALPQEEIPSLIRQFDVALAPYPDLKHSFYFSPLKLFEYMGCGIPVVAAGVGQIAEVVKDGTTGFLYPPGDLNALSNACGRLLADASLRQRLGQASAELIHDRYTWDHDAARVIELARSLIPSGHSTDHVARHA
jgi:glycosyltransferase involved in cell wall biosynthesis